MYTRIREWKVSLFLGHFLTSYVKIVFELFETLPKLSSEDDLISLIDHYIAYIQHRMDYGIYHRAYKEPMVCLQFSYA